MNAEIGAAGDVLEYGPRYRHEALIYAGVDEFLQTTLEFITDGVAAGEAILVVLDEDKIEAIQSELGSDACAVTFADMTDVGANPARIIGLWTSFLAEHADTPSAVRGIGEPIYAARTPEELIEFQLHEALLNVAFPDCGPFWLLCPYDLDQLPDDVVAEAFRTHPYIANGADRRVSPLYQPPDASTVFAPGLSEAPAGLRSIAFDRANLGEVRQSVAEYAARMHFHAAQVSEVVTAVNELVTNAVTHGGGHGVARVWERTDVLYFEVADTNWFTDLLAGRIPPDPGGTTGRGLWIANQLCDLLQIRTTPEGTVIRGQVRRIGSA